MSKATNVGGETENEMKKEQEVSEGKSQYDELIRDVMKQIKEMGKRIETIEEESKILRRRLESVEQKKTRSDRDSFEYVINHMSEAVSLPESLNSISAKSDVEGASEKSALLLSSSTSPPSDLDIKLYYAAKDGRVDEVRGLLRSEAKSSATVHCGSSALLTAAWNGHMKVVSELLNNGADANVANTWTHETPLHYAAFDGNTDMLATLLYHGADVNVRNMLGKTPLHIATFKGFIDCVHMLLESGADPLLEDNNGKKPAFFSSTRSIQEMLEYYSHSSTCKCKTRIHRS